MVKLTSEEDEGIKNILISRGVPPDELVDMSTETALHWWYKVCDGAMAHWRNQYVTKRD